MQTKRKCAQCNTLNDENQMYCVHCGKYLQGKVLKKEASMTIWGMDATPAVDRSDAGRGEGTPDAAADSYRVICPECSHHCPTSKDCLPLSCSECGYFFQAGIDTIVQASGLSKMKKPMIVNGVDITKSKEKADAVPDIKVRNVGPLKRMSVDKSMMRLNSVTASRMPEMMKPAGNILGKDGNLFGGLRSDKQISIWHTAAGWYARATIGTPLYNGVPMSQGIQMKLAAGDLLVLDTEQFMVEIIGV